MAGRSRFFAECPVRQERHGWPVAACRFALDRGALVGQAESGLGLFFGADAEITNGVSRPIPHGRTYA